MITWIYRTLPGPTVLRILLFMIVTVAFLIGLHFFYEWVGATFLDPGGGVG